MYQKKREREKSRQSELNTVLNGRNTTKELARCPLDRAESHALGDNEPALARCQAYGRLPTTGAESQIS